MQRGAERIDPDVALVATKRSRGSSGAFIVDEDERASAPPDGEQAPKLARLAEVPPSWEREARMWRSRALQRFAAGTLF